MGKGGIPYSGKQWQDKALLFRLFGGEKFGERPNNGKWISVKLSEKTLSTTYQCFLLYDT